MKANELRIGNWVNRGEQPDGFVIDEYSFSRIENPKHDYQPIKLNHDWIMRFGFQEMSLFVYEIDMGISSYRLKVIMPKEGDFVAVLINDLGELSECAIRSMMHVHQLQNLFFALSGKELTIK